LPDSENLSAHNDDLLSSSHAESLKKFLHRKPSQKSDTTKPKGKSKRHFCLIVCVSFQSSKDQQMSLSFQAFNRLPGFVGALFEQIILTEFFQNGFVGINRLPGLVHRLKSFAEIKMPLAACDIK
jgi:hypothetical protein